MRRSSSSASAEGRTVRTEITVERQGMTLLMGGMAGFDTCPLCGSKLGPAEADQARLRLPEKSGPVGERST
jgi:hypothetical protein